MAEAWALVQAIQWVTELQIDNFILEIDCKPMLSIYFM